MQDGAISKKDVEVDWRDRLKHWKRRGMTSGAVTGFDDQGKLQKFVSAPLAPPDPKKAENKISVTPQILPK